LLKTFSFSSALKQVSANNYNSAVLPGFRQKSVLSASSKAAKYAGIGNSRCCGGGVLPHSK